MTKKQSKPKMGRPPLPPNKRRGASMGFRPTPTIRAELEEAARANGRSMSHEVEARLERSFLEFGKEETFLVAQLLAKAIQTIEAVTGKNWMDDPEAHRQTQVACIKILDAFRPPAGASSISTDLISEVLGAAESSTVGTDAATRALMLEFDQVAHPAKFFRMKKKGGVSS